MSPADFDELKFQEQVEEGADLDEQEQQDQLAAEASDGGGDGSPGDGSPGDAAAADPFGGDTAAASATTIPDGAQVVFVDDSGQQIGTGTFSAQTGTVEQTQPQTTVIQETSTQASDSSSGAAPGAPSSGSSDSSTESPSDPGAPAPDPDSIPGIVEPEVFKFKKTETNWQETPCTTIVFGHAPSPFLPLTVIKVGVIVGAPITLRDGRHLSEREAQLDSANAAQAAADIIRGLLNTGAIIPTEIQPRFTGFMFGAIQATGLGYRVQGCHPTG